MADFDEIQKRLSGLKSELQDLSAIADDTNKYTSGLVKSLSDLSTTASTGGALWSIIGRASTGTGLYAIQNRLRSLTVVGRLIENQEKSRVKRAKEYNEAVNKQATIFDNMVESYTKISKLTEDISKNTDEDLTRLTKYSAMTESISAFRIKQVGFEKYISEANDNQIQQMKKRLAIERQILNESGEGYKLSERNQKIIDSTFKKTSSLKPLLSTTGSFKDALKDTGIFSPGGLLQQLTDPDFFETQEMAEQFLALKDEIETFSGFFKEQNAELDKEKARKKKIDDRIKEIETKQEKREERRTKLREERKDLGAVAGEDADYLRALEDRTQLETEREQLQTKIQELSEQARTVSARMGGEPGSEYRKAQDSLREELAAAKAKEKELADKIEYINIRKIENAEAALQSSEEMEQRKTRIDNRLTKMREKELEENKELRKLRKEASEINTDTQQKLVDEMEQELEFRKKSKELLEEDLAERGVTYDERKAALTIPTSPRDRKLQRRAARQQMSAREAGTALLKKLSLPITGLYATIKTAFTAYMTKKNFNKVFQVASMGIKVFIQILYAITLLGLLVYVLHKSGFIDGVKAFIEKYQDEISNYFEIVAMFFTGLFDFLKGTIQILIGLFSGNNQTIKEGVENLGKGLEKIFLGAVGTLIGFLGGVFLMSISGIGMVIKKTVDDARQDLLGFFGKVAGAGSGAAIGAKLGAMVGLAIPVVGPGIGAIIGGLLGAAIGGSMGKSAGTATGEALGLPGYASGGLVPNTGMAIVGEQGPEIVKLPAGARVYSNAQSRNMMAPTTINVSVNGRIGASDAELNDIAKKIGQKINMEMNRYSNSGFRA